MFKQKYSMETCMDNIKKTLYYSSHTVMKINKNRKKYREVS